MNEEELELWFDEEKEKLTNAYLKKIGVGEDQEETAKKKKGETKDSIEKNFLLDMRKLRRGYQKQYDAIITKKERSKKSKEISDIVFGPLMKFLKFLFKIIKKIWHAISFIISIISDYIKKEIKPYLKKKIFKLKEFSIFHIRPKILPAYQPTKNHYRSFMRPVKKDIENSKAFRKNTIKLISKKTSELLSALAKYSKVVIQFLTEYYKKVSEYIKKKYEIISKPIKKVTEKMNELSEKYIKPLLPKKGEE